MAGVPFEIQGALSLLAFVWLGLFSSFRVVPIAAPLTFGFVLFSQPDKALPGSVFGAIIFTASAMALGGIVHSTVLRLRQIRTQLEKAQEIARVGSWEWDVVSGAVIWSPYLYQLNGKDPDRWTPTLEGFLELMDEEDRNRVQDAIKASMATGDAYKVEYGVRHSDGRRTVVEAHGEWVRDASGRPVRLVGTALDISAAKRAEELAQKAAQEEGARKEAERARERIEEVLESISDAYYLVDRDWKLWHVNAEAERAFRKPREQLIGAHIWEAFPEAEPILRPRYEQVWERGEPDNFEFFFEPHQRWYEIRAFRGPPGLSVFFRDITEQKITEEGLHQAQKMESIGTLTAGITHDFNNLLTVVLANAEILYAHISEGDVEAHDALRDIRQITQRGAELVSQLLLLSRKRSRVELVPMRVGDAVEEVRSSLLRLIPSSIEIELDLDPELPSVRANPTGFQQILLNLAVNARDAMPNGGILSIRSTPAEFTAEIRSRFPWVESRTCVAIEVSDTGQGIPADVKERLFEPFFTTKEPGKGTGLGLAVVYGLVKRHGGAVDVQSVPGRGSTFRILLPTAPEESLKHRGAPHRESSDGPTTGGRQADLKGKTILIAEDEPSIRSALKRALKRLGHDVLAAEDGAEALEIYRKERQHIGMVITDMVMPKLGGAELVKQVRELEPRMRFLYSTGYDEADPEVAGYDPEIPVLGKPWTLDQLEEAVGRAPTGR